MNGPGTNLDVDDRLQQAGSTVAEDPSVLPRERVSGTDALYEPGLNIICQLLPEFQSTLSEDLQTPPLEDCVPLAAVPFKTAQESAITESVSHTTSMEDIQPSPKPQKTRNKRKRDLLNGRTELTSDELKEIRETYLQRQDVLRTEMEVKRRGREAMLLFDRFFWAVPHDSGFSSIL